MTMKGALKQTMHPAVKMRLEDNLLNNAKTMFSCAAVVNSFLTANGESVYRLETCARRESLEVELHNLFYCT